MATTEDLEARVEELERLVENITSTAANPSDIDIVWVIVSAVLVFFMQVGFAMLEVGSVSPKNTKAVLIKNIGDASLGALCWWLLGFALAFGEDRGGLVGTDMFALSDGTRLGVGQKEAEWMFNWAFAATSVTIVSGAIAERVKIAAYVIYAIVLTSFIYPLVVHWAWHPAGWASPYRSEGSGLPLLAGCGAVDFAGSGVVHMVGGTAALVAAHAVKARRGRFARDGSVRRLPQQSPALQTLGTLILWVGWYAFNAGSSITVSEGRSVVAARAVVSTTIGPAAGVLVMVVSLKILEKKFDTRGVNNGILSGLVAITAGAPVINPEGAFVIGVVSAGVYYASAGLLLRLKIDDVVDAAPVHLFCGIWGLVATGLFTTPEGWELTYDAERRNECCGLFYGCGAKLLAANLALLGAILAWVGLTSAVLFYTIERVVGLRVPANEEETGMDRTRHNSFASVGPGHGGNGVGKVGPVTGTDAVARAVAKAHMGWVDETVGGAQQSRSQQSSRAGSLTSTKQSDLGMGLVANGKPGDLWAPPASVADHRLPEGSSGGGVGGADAGRPRNSSKHLFAQAKGQGGSARGSLGSLGPSISVGSSGGGPAVADAVTPSVGRGTSYAHHNFGGPPISGHEFDRGGARLLGGSAESAVRRAMYDTVGEGRSHWPAEDGEGSRLGIPMRPVARAESDCVKEEEKTPHRHAP